MRLRLFHRKRRTLEELENIRVTRSDGIRRVLGVSGIIFLALVAFLASMLVLPPLLDLQTLRQEREQAELALRRARAKEAEALSRLHWIMMDPEYFEQLARDRANQAKDGETVIRRPSSYDSPPPRPPKRD